MWDSFTAFLPVLGSQTVSTAGVQTRTTVGPFGCMRMNLNFIALQKHSALKTLTPLVL